MRATRVPVDRLLVGLLSALAAMGPLAAPAQAQLFFIIPIPRSNADPESIGATAQQRKLAMCAAFHQEVIDPDLDGKRDQSWHGEVIHAAMQRLSDFADAKRLVGAYMGQWNRQQKQNYESGKGFGRLLIEACAAANLPAFKVQVEYWKSLKPDATGEAASLLHIPARQVVLDGAITSADFPTGFHATQASYTTGVVLQIDRKGAASRCDVEQSSGSDQIDQATCTLLIARARFTPAVENGVVAVQEFPYSQTWKAP